MADERIDIEVTDKVNPNVEKNLRGIGEAADRSHNYVQRLKAELSSINTSAVTKLQQASNSASRALANEMRAQATLTKATASAAVQDAKAATEKQRLATETARTEAAQARAAAATARASTAQLRAAQAAQRAATSTGDLAARADRLRATLDPLAGAQSRHNAEMSEARTLLSAGAINMRTYVAAVDAANARLNAAKGAQDNFNNSVRRGAAATKLAGHHQANLVAQLNDIGVSLASGQNPFIVLIQQGSQLQDLSMRVDGGFKTLIATTLRMFAPFAAVAAIVGVLAVEFKRFSDEVEANAKPQLEAYIDTLGLTKDETKRLLEETGGATVTMGDMWRGFWATVGEGLAGFSDEWAAVTGFVGQAWQMTVDFLYNAFVGFYGLVVGGMRGIAKTVMNLPSVAGETAKSIANVTLAAIEFLANGVVDAINAVADKAETITSLVGVSLGRMERVTLGRFQRTGANVADVFATEVTGAVREADATLTAFGQRWEANSIAAARQRIGNAAQEIIDDRPEQRAKKERQGQDEAAKAAERRAHAMEILNLQLDNELATMRLLKDERAIQQRMDSIVEELARKNITLTETEAEAIRGKVRAIEEFKYVQSEMDRITEAAVAPQRTYNAAIEAANDLLARGVITQRQFNEEVGRAARVLEDANDPLASYRRDLEQQEQLLGLYGTALEDASYQQRIMNELAAKYGGAAEAYRSEAAALMERNRALQNSLYVQQTIQGLMSDTLARDTFISNMQAMYAEVERLRQQDIVSHEEAERLKAAIQARYQEMRLSGFSNFFGELASLQSSGSKELAAIGKAAAVAQATIDGYVAVQKALASAPPPLNYALAAAVAVKTGAQVAGILSTNVGSFANGGQFMVEGRAGIDNNNINMNVSRGERVTIETPAQQRANDGGGGSVVQGDVKIINQFDEREFISAMDSDEGERIILNVIKRNPNVVNAAGN